MTSLRFLFFASVLSLSTAWAGAALADVPPADACTPTATAGTACENAGTNADQPGTCQTGTCPHTGPGPDGGLVTTDNPCMLCMESASSGGGSTASSGSTSSGGGSSCSVGAVGRGGAFTGAMALVGLAALLAGRRRRRS